VDSDDCTALCGKVGRGDGSNVGDFDDVREAHDCGAEADGVAEHRDHQLAFAGRRRLGRVEGMRRGDAGAAVSTHAERSVWQWQVGRDDPVEEPDAHGSLGARLARKLAVVRPKQRNVKQCQVEAGETWML